VDRTRPENRREQGQEIAAERGMRFSTNAACHEPRISLRFVDHCARYTSRHTLLGRNPMLRTLLLASLIAFSLAACGNKGPLVLPDQKPAPAPQSKDKDKSPPAGATQPAPSAGGGAANGS
jgi:predicted small lipoprotein YifL